MQIFALVIVFWSFVGGPALCRAGILVDCCRAGIAGHETSHDTPDKHPGENPEYPSDSSHNCCPCDHRDKYSEGDNWPDDAEARPDDAESSLPRDCDSCAESCNVVSPHSKQTDGDDFAIWRIVSIATAHTSYEAFLPQQHRSRNPDTMQMDERVPIPDSDRPLLI